MMDVEAEKRGKNATVVTLEPHDMPGSSLSCAMLC
jgi:hypothetical protein